MAERIGPTDSKRPQHMVHNQRGIDRPPLNENQLGGVSAAPILRTSSSSKQLRSVPLAAAGQATRIILTTDARQGIYTYRDTSRLRKPMCWQLAGQTPDPHPAESQQVPGQEKINNYTSGDPGRFHPQTGGYTSCAKHRTRDNRRKLDYVLSPNTYSADLRLNAIFPTPRFRERYSVVRSAKPR